MQFLLREKYYRKVTTKFNEQYKTLVRLAAEAAQPAHIRYGGFFFKNYLV